MVVGIHAGEAPARCGHRRIKGTDRPGRFTGELLLLLGTDAKGIRQCLADESLQQPALIDAIARTFNRSTAGGKIQGTAGAEETIQQRSMDLPTMRCSLLRGGHAGIEQHGAPQGHPCTKQGHRRGRGYQLSTQLTRALDHWQQITVATRCVSATGKMTAGISAAQIQPEHGKAIGLKGEAKTPQALTPTGAAETVQQQHQPSGRCAWQVGAGLRAIQKRQQLASGCSTTR